MTMNKIIKLFLSLIILLCAILPYLTASDKSGALETISSIDVAGIIILIISFFLAIAYYCKALQECLTLIAPHNRKASPKSVWYMFLMPFNFIEDFFIMISISNSLEEEAKHNSKLENIKDFGMVTGIGWSIAQILSFIPNMAGQIAGGLGLVLWIMHWRFIIKINKLLIVK